LAPKFPSNGIEYGVMLHESILERNLKTNFTNEPVWLSDHLVYLGEIERKIEKKQAMGETVIFDAMTADYLWDDTALVYKLPQGFVGSLFFFLRKAGRVSKRGILSFSE
jgi:7,8-dihydropterin-6-yl-methyl-4-(beta-D-ribofuranosyl)aminobenzene 5'-phosphate synthase